MTVLDTWIHVWTRRGDSQTPVRVSGNLVFEALSVDPMGFHACGLTAAHQVYC